MRLTTEWNLLSNKHYDRNNVDTLSAVCTHSINQLPSSNIQLNMKCVNDTLRDCVYLVFIVMKKTFNMS